MFKSLLVTLSVILTLIFSSSCREQKQVSNLENSPATVQISLAGLKLIEDIGNEVSPQFADIGIVLYKVELEVSGERAPFESWPSGEVLHQAAEYYAAISNDFDVSVRDVLTAGLWPYETIPSEANLDLKIYGGHRHARILDSLLSNPDDLLLVAKHDILSDYLKSAYKRSAKALGIQSENLLPRDERFWINPYTGTPMGVGNRKGDVTYYEISELPKLVKFVPAGWVDPDWTFPVINTYDISDADYASGNEKHTSSHICCWLTHDTDYVAANEEYCLPFSCTCASGPQTCEVCWTYDCATEVMYVDLTALPCNTSNPPAGGYPLPCPSTMYDSVNNHDCDLVGTPTTDCTYCAGLDTGCDATMAEVNQLISDLQNEPDPNVEFPGATHVVHCTDCDH